MKIIDAYLPFRAGPGCILAAFFGLSDNEGADCVELDLWGLGMEVTGWRGRGLELASLLVGIWIWSQAATCANEFLVMLGSKKLNHVTALTED